jgi:hypothetical protein
MTINNVQSQSSSNSQNTGDSMQYFITENPRFQGAYIAHTPNGSFECANIHTARSYIPNTREFNMVRSSRLAAVSHKQPTIACQGFVSPSGQYYAVVSFEINKGEFSDVRIDCHNVHTLRAWMRDGVSHKTLLEAILDRSNIRPQGGWGA